jgi:DNA-binding MarR family transcriptional regulator
VNRLSSSSEPWRQSNIDACVCTQLRRTSRAISAVYDRFLAECGLTVTQYSILVRISRFEPISRSALAAEMGMERTTLTRNLRPLERQSLIGTTSSSDRREHMMKLTASGQKKLTVAFPLWEQAQQHVLTQVGKKRAEEMRELLHSVADQITSPPQK